MSVFSFANYRAFLRSYIAQLPKKGRGEISRIAENLGVHATLISLVLAGDRDLTAEQVYDLAQYMSLTELETEYLSLLVQLERAGNARFKKHIKNKLEKTKFEATKIGSRYEHDRRLTDDERAVFYSSYLYSSIRLFASTRPKGVTLEEIVDRFQIARTKALDMISFLLSVGLITEGDNRYMMGANRTFLEHGSPHLPRHHGNWRIKAIQKAETVSENELMFTSPMSLSRTDFMKIREELAELLKRVSSVVKDSPAEDIGCLNIDLFWIDR